MKLKAKPWINQLPYIVNRSEKGSSSKGKMSKTARTFVETVSQVVVVNWRTPRRVALGQESRELRKDVAKRPSKCSTTGIWVQCKGQLRRGKAVLKNLVPELSQVLRSYWSLTLILQLCRVGVVSWWCVCGNTFGMWFKLSWESGYRKKKSHNTPIYSLLVRVRWELCSSSASLELQRHCKTGKAEISQVQARD